MEDKLLSSLLAKIQEVLMGETEQVSNRQNDYLAWCLPGIPFQAADLDFAIDGMTKIGDMDTKEAGAETSRLVRNALEFSRIANSIPKVNMIDGIFELNGDSLCNIYKDVLRFSRIPESELSKEEEDKVKILNDMLHHEITYYKPTDFDKKNPLKKREKTPMLEAYEAKRADYEIAVLEYNQKRLSALNAETPKDVQDFSVNGTLYKRKVERALDAWLTEGYKETVEDIQAFIGQTTHRSMALVKRELEGRLNDDTNTLTDAASGSNFYFTSLYPADFIRTDKGWMQFEFRGNSMHKYDQKTVHTTKADASLRFGLWTLKGDAGNIEQKKMDGNFTTEGFSIKFKITQAMLGRNWFSPEFLTSKYWNWDPMYGVLSDGKQPANGRLTAYTTTAIFIKDIEIQSSSLVQMNSIIEEQIKGGASVHWGPFRIGGSHNTEKQKDDVKDAQNKQMLKVDGMQLIAFKCHALPKAPDCMIPDDKLR